MNTIKTTGFIIRATTVGDYNKMLTVISPSLGKISVWAKGVKSMRSKSGAAVSPLCYSEFVLTKKGDAYTLSQASLIENFYHLRESVRKLAYAMYFAELTGLLTEEMMAADDILKLLLNTLHYLERDKKSPEELRGIFELKIACCSGFTPCAACCVSCGEDAGWFDVRAGGTVCGECRSESAIEISKPALELMRFYIGGRLYDVLTKSVDTSALEEVLRISEDFLAEQIDRKIPTLDYLKKVISDPVFE